MPNDETNSRESLTGDQRALLTSEIKLHILGVVVLIASGQITGAQAAGAYDTIKECNDTISEKLKNIGDPPPGVRVGILCMDLSDNIAKMKAPPKKPMGLTDI